MSFLRLSSYSCLARDKAVLGLCYPYIAGDVIISSTQHTPDEVVLSFSRLNTSYPAACIEHLKALLCLSIFPVCGPRGEKVPLCREACDIAVTGPCALSSSISPLLASNCGEAMPIAGDQPECIQLPSGKLSMRDWSLRQAATVDDV